MRRSLSSERGMTLFEVALMLIATMAVVAVLMPSLSATLRDARAVRASGDMADIRTAILAFQSNTLFTNFTQNGALLGTRMALLVSDGDVPNVGSTAAWQALAGSAANIGFLEEHLVLNSFNGGSSYPTGLVTPWRGAYLNAPVDPDPWGNRYAVNVDNMGVLNFNDVVVYSAGPDEDVDTNATGNPLVAGGDDLILLVES